jgi:hypothetical protein
MILSVTNTITLIGLKRMRKKIEHGIHTTLNRKRIEMERRIVQSKEVLKRYYVTSSFFNRYYHYDMWFYFHLDSLCCYIICFSISR